MKNESVEIYKKKPGKLYELLHHLYCLSKNQSKYGYTFYQQLCKPYDTSVLDYYIKGKYQLKKIGGVYHYPDENLVQIGSSCCIVRSEMNFPELLRIFHYYSRNIFVCDFHNQDYFWLTKHYHEIRKPEYNEIGVEKV